RSPYTTRFRSPDPDDAPVFQIVQQNLYRGLPNGLLEFVLGHCPLPLCFWIKGQLYGPTRTACSRIGPDSFRLALLSHPVTKPNPDAYSGKLRKEDPLFPRLRCRRRNPHSPCALPFRAAWQHRVAQARGPAAGVLLQDPRRL